MFYQGWRSHAIKAIQPFAKQAETILNYQNYHGGTFQNFLQVLFLSLSVPKIVKDALALAPGACSPAKWPHNKQRVSYFAWVRMPKWALLFQTGGQKKGGSEEEDREEEVVKDAEE